MGSANAEPRGHEVEINKLFCYGRYNVYLPESRKYVDCVEKNHAWEFEYPNKWAESIGQSMHYADALDLKPGIVFIITDEKDYHNVNLVRDLIKRRWLGIDIDIVSKGKRMRYFTH